MLKQESKKVFVVTAGEYSAYRVIGIFTSEEKAQEFKDTFPCGDYNEIETYDLDPNYVELVQHGYYIWRVLMLKDGTVEVIRKLDIDVAYVTDMGFHVWARSKSPAYKGKGVQDCLNATLWAKTEKQAIKIVNEKRAQMIAEGKF